MLPVAPEALKRGSSFRYQRTRADLNMQLFFTLSYHLRVRGPGHVSLGQPEQLVMHMSLKALWRDMAL